MPKILRNGEIVTITAEEYNRIKNLNTPLKHIDENGYAIGDDTTITIDGVTYGMETFFVNNIPFQGISSTGFTTVNTKTFVEEPIRQNDGSMPNINDHETFIVPRATFNFKFFDIQSYRRLLKATESNSFTVRYFDKDIGKWVVHDMYLTPQEMTRIYNIGTFLIGVIDYEVSFVGTLNDVETYIIKFNSNYDGTTSEANRYRLQSYRGNYYGNFTYNKGDTIHWLVDDNYYISVHDTFIADVDGSTSPAHAEYWQKLPVGKSSIEVKWGYSFNLPTPESLFVGQSGKAAQKWNTLSNGEGYTYYPNKNITVTEDITLYAVWE